jgi:hypothetical protein
MGRLSLEERALRRVPFVVEPIERIAGFRLDDSRRGNQKLFSRRKRVGAVLTVELGDPSPHGDLIRRHGQAVKMIDGSQSRKIVGDTLNHVLGDAFLSGCALPFLSLRA